MQHTYFVSGMTCAGCEAKVKALLEGVAGEGNVTMDLEGGKAHISMDHHVPIQDFKEALNAYPKYSINEGSPVAEATENFANNRSWIATYRPLLVLFTIITLVSVIAGWNNGNFSLMTAMRIFMAGFFLSFSYFKLLDLRGFAESYATYDIIGRSVSSWGYVYAFIELGLGLAYAANFQLEATLWITLIVMTISIIGVLQAVLNKRRIQCACLGVVFNLPMSTVTIIEDALMIGMSAWMLWRLG